MTETSESQNAHGTGPDPSQSKAIQRIPGWLFHADRILIPRMLEATTEVVGSGDLAEIGVYMGKSAALIGCYRKPDETFTVLDLFGSDADDHDNRSENDEQYRALSRARFESFYRTVQPQLPVVVEAPSTRFLDHVAPASLRFLHIDGSHLFEHVRDDAAAARIALKEDGIVVFDDIRSEHTPGVSAAVWQAVTGSGLVPVAVTPSKFYGTWGSSEPYVERLRAVASAEGLDCDPQQINGHTVLRLSKAQPLLRFALRAQIAWHDRRARKTLGRAG
jgi:hypothetical protein